MLNELFVFDFIPGDQKLVVERLEEMDKTRSRIKSAITQFSELMPTMTDSQLKQYTRRIQTTGELKAMEWLVAQKPSS